MDTETEAFLCFNSFLELALGLEADYAAPWIPCVSILVFLELALGAKARASAKLSRMCFNPCFLGTCPRRRDGGPETPPT